MGVPVLVVVSGLIIFFLAVAGALAVPMGILSYNRDVQIEKVELKKSLDEMEQKNAEDKAKRDADWDALQKEQKLQKEKNAIIEKEAIEDMKPHNWFYKGHKAPKVKHGIEAGVTRQKMF